MLKYLFICVPFFLISCGTTKKTMVNRSPTVTSSVATNSIVKDARNQIRRPYRYGGESPNGFDCSGLVQYVYSKNGIQLPRRSADQARYGKSISLGQARPGDLIFFKSGGKITHVGIVSDTRGKYPSMVHSSSSAGVSEVDLDTSDYWRKRYAYIRRM